ncbi:hypothetical protein HK24_01835 [Gluconobacter sp. DsW_058]|nr:hypothetical protein HK24_01835 [Gluconobacter sp. DsW_058]
MSGHHRKLNIRLELGGLVQKAGLVELTADDRATLLGAFLELAEQLQVNEKPSAADLKTRWRRRLNRFHAEGEDDEGNGL